MQYRIVQCRWQSGERYVMLVEAETGQPPWWPMLYVTTQLRNTGRSVATMEAALRAIQVLLAYTDTHGIDLEERFETREFLDVYEVDNLVRLGAARDESDPARSERTRSRGRIEDTPVRTAHHDRQLPRVVRKRHSREPANG